MSTNPDLEAHTRALAAYMSNGRMFEAKGIADSNFRQLLQGLAGGYFTRQGYLITLEEEYFPDRTTLYLSEWEKALQIPDDCFTGTGTTLERRRDIIAKLAGMNIQTVEDFVALGAIFGNVVTVTPGADLAFPPYAIPYLPNSLQNARFTVIVSGLDLVGNVPPYQIPLSLIVSDSLLQCLYANQIPANCTIIFRNLEL